MRAYVCCAGNELENIIKNPSLANLVGGINIVTLSDEEARRRRGQKSVLERAGPPAFDVAIEMLDRNSWRVHEDLSEAVDTILAGIVQVFRMGPHICIFSHESFYAIK